MRTACALTVLLGVVAHLAPADAQDAAAAEALFREGRELMGRERYEEACDRFALSQRLDPALGTLLNLALCHELLGDLATAWARFTEAAEMAARREDDREDVARRRADTLEPRLSRLAIKLDGEPPEGLVVTRNGVDVTDLVGTAVPVNPGTYKIRATAPDRVPWTQTIAIKEEGATYVLRLGADEEETPARELEETAPPSDLGGDSERRERQSLKPFGVVWLGAGGAFAGGAALTHRAGGLTGARNTLLVMSAGSLLTGIVVLAREAHRDADRASAKRTVMPFTTGSATGVMVRGRF